MPEYAHNRLFNIDNELNAKYKFATRCQDMPTTDCDCYNELINMKETFKRKCFGKTSAGLYKHLRSCPEHL